MEITSDLKELIKQKRQELGLSLTAVSDLSKKQGFSKPVLSVSALSALERGKLKGLKDETFQMLAHIVGIPPEKYISSRPLLVAFGVSCWAAPIINSIVSDNESDESKQPELLNLESLSLTCFAEENGKPVFINEYNQHPKTKMKHHILTANEIMELLQREEIDIGFLPVLAAKEFPGLSKIARCMNSAKGGIYLYVIAEEGTKELEAPEENFGPTKNFNYEQFGRLKKILEATHCAKPSVDECRFVFPRNSSAQHLVEQLLFDNTPYKKQELEITSIEYFIADITTRIKKFFSEKDARFFVYAGWDYQVDKLNKEFKKGKKIIDKKTYIGHAFDSYRFTKYGAPFTQMSYDCITKEDKTGFLQTHPGLTKLLTMLSENVKVLTNNKFKKNNSRYRMISDFLEMDQDFTDSILNRITWEFLLYPELFDKNLK